MSIEMSGRSEQQRLLQLDGDVCLAVSDVGSGPAVVLLHGWPVTSFHWRLTVPALVEKGFRAVTIDLRGLGASTGGAPDYAKETLARDVIGVLEHVGVDAFAVVGHDWGGTVAYLLAAAWRDRVRAMVIEEELVFGTAQLVEPGRSYYPRWHGPFMQQIGLAEALVPGREDIFYGTFLRQSPGPAGLAAEAEAAYLAAYRSSAVLGASLGYYRCGDEDDRALRAHSARALTLPVLTVGGGFGMGIAVGQDLLPVAPGLRHLQIPSAGHYPAEQQAEAFNSALTNFFCQHVWT